MSITGDINNFFNEYGDQFDLKAINYTKKIVSRIKTSPVLENFLNENAISTSMLLNEIIPISQYKLRMENDEKLDMREIQSILNIILFSNELEKLLLEDHVEFSSIGPMGEIFYVADKYAASYFNEKYNINVKVGEEFDYTILEDENNFGYDLGFGGNSMS